MGISNLTNGAVMEQIQILIDKEIIEVLNDSMNATENSKVIVTCLDALENIIKMGENFVSQGAAMNPYLLRLESCGGIKLIEKLQHHPDSYIYNRVARFIDHFFNVDVQ